MLHFVQKWLLNVVYTYNSNSEILLLLLFSDLFVISLVLENFTSCKLTISKLLFFNVIG